VADSTAHFIGCAFITIAYLRNGIAEIDVYPSQSVLRHSITVLLVGGYLFPLVFWRNSSFWGVRKFVKGLLVLLGTSLVVLLLSSGFDRSDTRAAI
jgi:hypothetical protein